MALKFKASGGTETLPEGTFDATLVKVEEGRNQDGTYLKWSFSLSLRGEARTVTGITPAHMDPGSKARFWTEALLGRPLRDDEEVDLEKLYGRGCRLEVGIVEKEGRQFSRIARVEKRGGVTLKAKAPEPPSEENLDDADRAF